ncbi:MAG: hypothetical protein JKY67_13060, partial [Pseudomonadales bacterium]|nr:hypothetical protein [Pseudomonadales bacterium]
EARAPIAEANAISGAVVVVLAIPSQVVQFSTRSFGLTVGTVSVCCVGACITMWPSAGMLGQFCPLVDVAFPTGHVALADIGLAVLCFFASWMFGKLWNIRLVLPREEKVGSRNS